MKICFVGNAGHVNLLSWVEYLSNNLGHEIHVITFNPPCDDIPNINFHLIDGLFIKNKIRYFVYIFKIKKIINKIKSDILIGYRLNSYGLMAILSGYHPVVLVAQGSDIFYSKNSQIQKLILQYVVRKSDLLQTWENHMGKKLLEFGAKKGKIFVMPKGVNTDVFKPDDKLNVDNRLTIISTRQLRKSYDHECVLRAISIVLEKITDLQYVICGDGEFKPELELLTEKLGIADNIKFLGKVEHNKLPLYLCASAIYVSMQPSDGVSSSLLEAMACGVFPIVPDNEANRLWIQDGINGFMVPNNNHNLLAKKIIIAYENRLMRSKAKNENIELVAKKACMSDNMLKITGAYLKLIHKS